jgi:hypothetical protein
VPIKWVEATHKSRFLSDNGTLRETTQFLKHRAVDPFLKQRLIFVPSLDVRDFRGYDIAQIYGLPGHGVQRLLKFHDDPTTFVPCSRYAKDISLSKYFYLLLFESQISTTY